MVFTVEWMTVSSENNQTVRASTRGGADLRGRIIGMMPAYDGTDQRDGLFIHMIYVEGAYMDFSPPHTEW